MNTFTPSALAWRALAALLALCGLGSLGLFPSAAGATAGHVASTPMAVPCTGDCPVRPDRIILLDATRVGALLFAVGERGIILRSTDDGAQWQTVRTPVTRTLSGIAFRDERRGVAVGHGGTLLRTEDGGGRWHVVDVADAGRDAVLGVRHLGEGRYVAHGAFGLYLVSDDDGRRWVRRQVVDTEFDRHVFAVLPLPDGTLLLLGESGMLARSRDGGERWEKLESPYPGSFFGGLVTARGSVLIFGMRGQVFRSTDGGERWQSVGLGGAAGIQGGRGLADGRIVLVGNAGLLAVSNDDGAHFQRSTRRHGRGLAQVLSTRAGEVFAVGEAGIERLDLPPTASTAPMASTGTSAGQEGDR